MLRVLDAGCGRTNAYHQFPDAHITGIDMDADALAINDRVHDKIVGDIQLYPLPPATFDIAVCWDVLEHLPAPMAALENIAQSLKPGGTLILGVPNLMSAKGVCTKLTPHSFHVWFYRHVFHDDNAGTPGYGPYKTFLRWSIRPAGIRRFAATHDLTVDRFDLAESGQFRRLLEHHRATVAVLRAVWPGDPFLSECRVELVRR